MFNFDVRPRQIAAAHRQPAAVERLAVYDCKGSLLAFLAVSEDQCPSAINGLPEVADQLFSLP